MTDSTGYLPPVSMVWPSAGEGLYAASTVRHLVEQILDESAPSSSNELDLLLLHLRLRVESAELPIGVRGTVDFGQWGGVIYISRSLDPSQCSFVIGHEIGHVLLSRVRRNVAEWRDIDALDGRGVERLCDKIAAELVLPMNWTKNLANGPGILTVDALIELAKRASVSPAILAKRLSDLGMRLVFVEAIYGPGGNWSITTAVGNKQLRQRTRLNVSKLSSLAEGVMFFNHKVVSADDGSSSLRRYRSLLNCLVVWKA